jgi:phosphatidylinositol alpha 1,6-mannosyltransferase
VREALPGARLAIAGDGPARAELEATAPRGVRFLGQVQGEALARLYASADVFCFPSTTDTFGQVLLEAAASGLATVAAAAGGAVELVRDGETGVLVPPGDPGALASALIELGADPRRRRALGRTARALARRRHWQSSLDELQSAYRAALATAGAQGHTTIVRS